jgi:DNA-binding transcriptional regulator YdaS (Cro superfamily)
MDFKTYWFGMSQGDRTAFAERVQRAPGYLQLVAGGFRRASPELAIAIDEKSDGKVKRGEMRPDIFGAPSPQPDQGRAAA